MTRWILATVAGALTLVPRPALGGEPASLEWNAPLSCRTRDAVLQRFAQGGGSGRASSIDTRVAVEQSAEDHYRARVELVAGHQWSERSLEASTCEAIAVAVVVILRVATAAAPTEPPSAPPASDAAPVVAGSPAPSTAAESIAPGPLNAPAARPGAPGVAPVEEDRGRGFSARAAFALDTGTRTDATPGFALGAAWRGAHVAFALELRAFAPPPTEPSSVAPSALSSGIDPALVSTVVPAGVAGFAFPVDAHAWLLTASVEACASEPLRRDRFLADACLGLAFEHPHFDSSASLALVPMGDMAAQWWFLPGLGARASARWLLDVPRTSPTSALVAFEPSLGVVMHLGK